MRHLASIQKITRIVPIENADRIELADVLGWHVVVEKGKFSAGDLVVYCEVDSILPDWLKELSGVRDKYLKTRKFRGVYSQGLCLPTSVLKDKNVKAAGFIREGEDVTKALGIKNGTLKKARWIRILERRRQKNGTQNFCLCDGSTKSFCRKSNMQIFHQILSAKQTRQESK